MQEVCDWLNGSVRALQTWRQRGLFPEPDIAIGKTIRWRRATVTNWIADQAARRRGRR